VRRLQDALRAHGFDPGPTDGAFGARTAAAVRGFQAANGLAVDGVVGPRTWAALASSTASSGGSTTSSGRSLPTGTVLRLGAKGPAVVALQDALRAHGFDPGASDGDFGPRTLTAVRRFQAARGLVVDGVVGPRTWAALV
jgi:peptidoglycan hydrolase-like protein with peptidoglycan-binding domain